MHAMSIARNYTHVLNNCEHKLDRYKWRHDNILYFITNSAKYLTKLEDKMSNFQIYADLQGHTVNEKQFQKEYYQALKYLILLLCKTKQW